MSNAIVDEKMLQLLEVIENRRTDKESLQLLKEAIQELQERYYEIEAEIAWNKEGEDD